MGKFLVSLRHLENWFVLQQRILPWRESPSTYRVWVSEIMLQQTQVITVIPFFERWVERFPTVQDLAHAELEEVLRYWAGLGYYSRARNLHRGAQKIVELGRLPQTRAEWLEVPGVGQYTAGAILSIAGHQPEAILDGNVERVLSRVRRVSRQKGDVEYKSRLWRLSRVFVETAHRHGIDPSHLNQSLMELGATICTPKKPKCSVCPLVHLCRGYEKKDADSFPPKKKPKVWVHLEEKVYAWVNDQGEVLLSVQPRGKWRAGLWDLPTEGPFPPLKKAALLGKIETQYVVTRHKVKRLTEVWGVQQQVKKKTWAVAESGFDTQSVRWISPGKIEVPVGAPTKKILIKIKELIS